MKIETREPAPRLIIDGQEVDIDSISDKSITLEQLSKISGNTPAWMAIIPKLNNEALVHYAQNFLVNSREESFGTYDYTLKKCIVPELLKRLSSL